MTPDYSCDVLIIGSGVVGICVGIALLEHRPGLRVLICDKEDNHSKHASGRNSGVLHAGFYYSPDSLKAKFCKDGNKEMRSIVREFDIPMQEVGKVVVSRNQEEDLQLDQLYKRGVTNGVDIELLDKSKLFDYEPLALTFSRFLWSPTTAIANVTELNKALFSKFVALGGCYSFNNKVQIESRNGEIHILGSKSQPKHVVNAGGAHADRISKSIGVGLKYAMLPFLGLYRSIDHKALPLRRLVYPVPHPINPFLGVHFTITTDQKIKIGPTAIPILGREQYSFSDKWSFLDISEALTAARALILNDAHSLREILATEAPNLFVRNLVKEGATLVPSSANISGWSRKPAGIRAQLVNLTSGRLEQDFIIEQYQNSTHILNAVSPGWTSAIPFGRWVANRILSEKF